MNWRTILLYLVTIVMLSVPGLYAQEEPAAEEKEAGLGLSAGIDYWSDYFWRGLDFYGKNEAVIFPWVSYSVLDTGLSLTVSGENNIEMIGDNKDDTNKGYYALDFGLGYTYSIEKIVTFGANGWAYWYYRSKDKLMADCGHYYNASYFTLIGSATFDIVPILTPTISYSHDFYISKHATTTGERFKDFYIQLALDQNFELTKETALDLKLWGSFFSNKSSKKWSSTQSGKIGISDIGTSLKVSTTAGIVTFYGQINYAYVPDRDFYTIEIDETTGATGHDKHHWWAAIGSSVAI